MPGVIKQIFDIVSSVTQKEFFVGLELEIETIYNLDSSILEEEFNILTVEDGSLRARGMEFLIPPSSPDEALSLFKAIHSQQYLRYREQAFSPRTSIHVHVNCLYFTEKQVRNFLLLYSIFEPLFFFFVGQDRKNNIHCVPIGYTHMSQYFYREVRDLIGGGVWHKYTAFNLLPLSTLGTVEFRHMEGHNNLARLKAWLYMIEVLWNNAQNCETDFTQETLLDISWLHKIERELLTTEVLMNMKEPVSFTLERNLIDVKLGLI